MGTVPASIKAADIIPKLCFEASDYHRKTGSGIFYVSVYVVEFLKLKMTSCTHVLSINTKEQNLVNLVDSNKNPYNIP